MKIEPCTITTTETKTVNAYISPEARDVSLAYKRFVCDFRSEPDESFFIPAALTLPASVQVPGYRAEFRAPTNPVELYGLLNELKHALIAAVGQALVEDEGVIDTQAAIEKACDAVGGLATVNQPQPARAPYTMETWPKGEVRIRSGPHASLLVTGVNASGVASGYLRLVWEQLAADYELSTDGGKTWQPCYQTQAKTNPQRGVEWGSAWERGENDPDHEYYIRWIGGTKYEICQLDNGKWAARSLDQDGDVDVTLGRDYTDKYEAGKACVDNEANPDSQPQPAADTLVTESGEWKFVPATQRTADRWEIPGYYIWKNMYGQWIPCAGIFEAGTSKQIDTAHINPASAARACEDHARERRQANEWVPVGVRVPDNIIDKVARTDDGQEGRAWYSTTHREWLLYSNATAFLQVNGSPLTVTAWREIREGETVGYFAAKGGA